MNKICTDILQSKKLVELGIDISTADMYYMYRHWEIDENTVGAQSDAYIGFFDSDFYYGADNGKTYHYIPAFSLSALIKMLPDKITIDNEAYYPSFDKKSIAFRGPITWDGQKSKSFEMDNILDAAFEMVCWLLENKKI